MQPCLMRNWKHSLHGIQRYLWIVQTIIRVKRSHLCISCATHWQMRAFIFLSRNYFALTNVFAHAIEHGAYFIIRATDIKMRRLLDSDLPTYQDCFDVRINRILTHSTSKKKWLHPELADQFLYNFCSIITGHVVIKRKGKKHPLQVNFSVAYKTCHYFLQLRNGESPPDVEGLIEKHALPIRPDWLYARQHRFRVPVSFTYRFS